MEGFVSGAHAHRVATCGCIFVGSWASHACGPDFGWGFMHIAPPNAKARTQPAHAAWPHTPTRLHTHSRNIARALRPLTGLSATLRRLISSQSQDRCKSFSTKTRDKQGFKPRRAAGARQVRAYTPTPCASAVSRVPRGHASDTPAPRLRGGRVDPLRWRRAVGCGGAWSGSGRRPCVGRRHKSSASGSSASP